MLSGCNEKPFTFEKVNMTVITDGNTNFYYGDYNISKSISIEHLTQIKNLFNGKYLYSDNPTCGFTENVSITLNNCEKFYFACDSCPIIYWQNKNKYFKLSSEEYAELMDILNTYGFVFPCI